MTRKNVTLIILTGVVVVVGALVGLTLYRPSAPGPSYTVTTLPTLGGFRTVPHAINDRGQIVGVAENPNRDRFTFLWDREQGFRNLGSFDEQGHSGRLHINNAGQIAGTTNDPNGRPRAFLWSPPLMERSPQLLGTLGGDHSMAADLNDKGQIVGWSTTIAGRQNAFLWDPRAPGQMRDLGTMGGPRSTALGVNDAGQVVGWSEAADHRGHVFFWDPNAGLTDLGPTGTGHTYACINNRGHVIWSYATPSGETHFKSWSRAAGVREMDFTAGESARPCGLDEANRFLISGKPEGLNVLARVLGRRQAVYLWDPNEGLSLLQDRLPVSDVEYFKATDMNEAGAIVGVLQTKGTNQVRAILLEPVEP
jgi:probable HAF family extracellular repeat protein